MKFFLKKYLRLLMLTSLVLMPLFANAEQVINLSAPSLIPKTELFISPRSGNFLVGSTFEAPIYINTNGININAVNIKLHFDPTKLSIVNPSGGKSIFGIWIEAPTYDNKKGTASLVGVIPGGIVTSSGLIATITFKALEAGDTAVNFTDYSSVNLNDGLGSEAKVALSGARYTLTPKTPDGVAVYSETHPFQDHWYNNTNPILSWDAPLGVDGYSVVLDNSPTNTPVPTINSNESSASYADLKDGVYYFHVRASVKGVWGNASHFQIKIDTNPPAKFTPEVSTLTDATGTKKYLVSFFTTDALSNIDHYEVGNVDKTAGDVGSPVFIQTESPYLVPSTTADSTRVIIHAFDTAGNVQESFVDLYPGFTTVAFLQKYTMYALIGVLLLLFLELLMHYLFGHHMLDHVRKAYRVFKGMPDTSSQKIYINPTAYDAPSPSENLSSHAYPTDNNKENFIDHIGRI